MAKKLDKTCSARLREDLASRTHLRLALARYFVSNQIDATGPANRPVCEKAIDACWESVREAAAGETAVADEDQPEYEYTGRIDRILTFD